MMAMGWILLLAAVMLLCSVRFDVELSGQERCLLSLTVSWLCLRREWDFRLDSDDMLINGNVLRRTLHHRAIRSSMMQLWHIAKRSNLARGMLMHGIRLDRLVCMVRVHTGDAARTAVLTGAFRTLYALLPAAIKQHTSLCLMPEFHEIPSAVKIRCIISCRVGILILAATLLGIASLKEYIAAGKED